MNNYLGNCNAPPNRRLSDRLYSAGPEATPELGNDTTRVDNSLLPPPNKIAEVNTAHVAHKTSHK